MNIFITFYRPFLPSLKGQEAKYDYIDRIIATYVINKIMKEESKDVFKFFKGNNWRKIHVFNMI
jgi:hypothetical protein